MKATLAIAILIATVVFGGWAAVSAIEHFRAAMTTHSEQAA